MPGGHLPGSQGLTVFSAACGLGLSLPYCILICSDKEEEVKTLSTRLEGKAKGWGEHHLLGLSLSTEHPPSTLQGRSSWIALGLWDSCTVSG